jgi:hypothetical protein
MSIGLERFIRWVFAAFVVLFFLFVILRFAGRPPAGLAARSVECDVHFSRDAEETAALAITPMLPVRNAWQAFREARGVCRRIPNLDKVNVRTNCLGPNGLTRTYSRLVFCR